jgi:hypothetical protein
VRPFRRELAEDHVELRPDHVDRQGPGRTPTRCHVVEGLGDEIVRTQPPRQRQFPPGIVQAAFLDGRQSRGHGRAMGDGDRHAVGPVRAIEWGGDRAAGLAQCFDHHHQIVRTTFREAHCPQPVRVGSRWNEVVERADRAEFHEQPGSQEDVGSQRVVDAEVTHGRNRYSRPQRLEGGRGRNGHHQLGVLQAGRQRPAFDLQVLGYRFQPVENVLDGVLHRVERSFFTGGTDLDDDVPGRAGIGDPAEFREQPEPFRAALRDDRLFGEDEAATTVVGLAARDHVRIAEAADGDRLIGDPGTAEQRTEGLLVAPAADRQHVIAGAPGDTFLELLENQAVESGENDRTLVARDGKRSDEPFAERLDPAAEAVDADRVEGRQLRDRHEVRPEKVDHFEFGGDQLAGVLRDAGLEQAVGHRPAAGLEGARDAGGAENLAVRVGQEENGGCRRARIFGGH